MKARYGIGEWYGEPLYAMSPDRRNELADHALEAPPRLPCPFRGGDHQCMKKGGVCTIKQYILDGDRIREPKEDTEAVVCPHRFAQGDVAHLWLAEVLDFGTPLLATEVPFMKAPSTGRGAGRIDLVIAGDIGASEWCALEVQAVYFSGPGMTSDFTVLLVDLDKEAPAPVANRRPDWRSSSAKRLLPQLQVKTPTLRRWGQESRRCR